MRRVYRRGRGTGDLSTKIENNEGQFWKRLRSAKDCNAGRKRKRIRGKKKNIKLCISNCVHLTTLKKSVPN